MTQPVGSPPVDRPMLEGGLLAPAWRSWFQSLARALSAGGVDKVDSAWRTARAAAASHTEIVAVAGLQGGGPLSANIALGFYRVQKAVADLPIQAGEGDWAYALDGRKPGEGPGAGTGLPVFFSRGVWVAVISGQPISA